MEEDILFVRVFVPYVDYNHSAIFGYDKNVYGELPIGTAVATSRGIGIIIEEIPNDKVPNINVYSIDRLANEKETKIIKRDWWDLILFIHQKLLEQGD